MKCYYELLEVERRATPEELKKAYRRKALELHPDKNRDRIQEATELFAQIQEAYEILSDPQERSWYDSHRDEILRGDDATDMPTNYNADVTPVEQVMRFCSTSCYSGIDDSPKGFFAVYRNLFVQLEQEEEAAIQLDAEALVELALEASTPFGDSSTPFDPSVRMFYNRFMHFSTVKSFRWFDEFRLSDIPDRRMRRMAQKRNIKRRDSARREFNDAVRSLAEFIRKRDPRFKQAQSDASAEKEQQQLRMKQQQEQKRVERRRMADNYQEQEWSKIDKEIEIDDVEEDLYYDEYKCVTCSKSFKSDRQFANHEKSKKHQEAVRRLRRELLKDGIDLDEILAEQQPEEVVDDKLVDDINEPEIVIQKEAQEYPVEVVEPEQFDIPVETLRISSDESDIWNNKKGKKKKGSSKQTSQSNVTEPSTKKKKKKKNTDLVCNICNESFDSRTKLFNHIKAEDHAYAK